MAIAEMDKTIASGAAGKRRVMEARNSGEIPGRDRISAAFRHDGSVAAGLDLGGSTVTGIADSALVGLLNRLGRNPVLCGIRAADTVQGISVPDADTLLSLRIDTFRIGSDRLGAERLSSGGLGRERMDRDSGEILDGRDAFGVPWRRKPGELYFSQTGAPLADGAAVVDTDKTLCDMLRRYIFPVPDFAAISSLTAAGRGEAQRCGLFPVLDRDCAGLFEMSARLRGQEAYYCDFHDDMSGVEELAERLLEYKTAYWGAVLDAFGEGEVAVAEADDYGSEASLLLDPSTIRRVFVERYRRLFAFIKKKNPMARIVFHSCGAIRSLIPDFIDAGIDALNPVQYTAAGMDLAGLKRDFGNDLVFWGGIADTRETLPHGTPEEVRDEVLRNMDILADGGGCVCAAIHNIQADAPAANIQAFIEGATGRSL